MFQLSSTLHRTFCFKFCLLCTTVYMILLHFVEAQLVESQVVETKMSTTQLVEGTTRRIGNLSNHNLSNHNSSSHNSSKHNSSNHNSSKGYRVQAQVQNYKYRWNKRVKMYFTIAFPFDCINQTCTKVLATDMLCATA